TARRGAQAPAQHRRKSRGRRHRRPLRRGLGAARLGDAARAGRNSTRRERTPGRTGAAALPLSAARRDGDCKVPRHRRPDRTHDELGQPVRGRGELSDISVRVDTPSSVHSRESGNPGPGSPQRDPRDACVAGCPSRGRAGIVRFATTSNTDACYTFCPGLGSHRAPRQHGRDVLNGWAMLVGAFYFPTDYGIAIDELARALEERGYESLFVCEHTHIPVSRRSPYPGGGELPQRYFHPHDPFVALTFAAAATRTLKLGTGIALIPQRDPIITAKAVASLDQLSGGRFVFAIGGGWNVEEMENHGARYETRFQLLRERVLAMKALWTQEQAEFPGRFVNFDPVWLYPKPKQKPHPPILLGGETDYTVRRVVEFCDGWFPRPRGGWEPKRALARLREAAIAAKRDP